MVRKTYVETYDSDDDSSEIIPKDSDRRGTVMIKKTYVQSYSSDDDSETIPKDKNRKKSVIVKKTYIIPKEQVYFSIRL